MALPSSSSSQASASQQASTSPTSLLSLPTETIEDIFTHVRNPQEFLKTCKRIYATSKNPAVRCKWMIRCYSAKTAFISACRYHRNLIRGPGVGLATCKALLNVLKPTPRYILQEAYDTLVEANAPHALRELLDYGIKLYHDDLALNTNDYFEYRDLICNPDREEDISQMTEQEILLRVKTLVERYKLDIDDTYMEYVIPDPILSADEDALMIFKATVRENQLILFKYLLANGAPTHYVAFLPNEPPTITTAAKVLKKARWNVFSAGFDINSFGDLHDVIEPKTEDIIFAAVAYRRREMVKLLLEKDRDKWQTDWGNCVLCACVQLAHDTDWEPGLDLLFSYFDAVPRSEFSKSHLYLYGRFNDAIRANDIGTAISILQMGYTFMAEDIKSPKGRPRAYGILGNLCRENNSTILDAILNQYQFSEKELIEMLKLCIKSDALEAAHSIAKSGQVFNPPSAMMEACVRAGTHALLDALVELRKQCRPGILDPKFKEWALIASAQGDIESMGILLDWATSCSNASAPEVTETTEQSEGQGTKRAASDTELENASTRRKIDSAESSSEPINSDQTQFEDVESNDIVSE